jgi:hypothetical protein
MRRSSFGLCRRAPTAATDVSAPASRAGAPRSRRDLLLYAAFCARRVAGLRRRSGAPGALRAWRRQVVCPCADSGALVPGERSGAGLRGDQALELAAEREQLGRSSNGPRGAVERAFPGHAGDNRGAVFAAFRGRPPEALSPLLAAATRTGTRGPLSPGEEAPGLVVPQALVQCRRARAVRRGCRLSTIRPPSITTGGRGRRWSTGGGRWPAPSCPP